MGVWIETIFKKSDTIISLSHPAWVCGLKLKKEGRWLLSCRVTPCVGVWIETISDSSSAIWLSMSHPAWVCGLKHTLNNVILLDEESHPAWVCGLKPYHILTVVFQVCVTPCVGVWIETLPAY